MELITNDGGGVDLQDFGDLDDMDLELPTIGILEKA